MDIGERTQRHLERFRIFGAEAGGGITRLLFDENWLKFQRHVMAEMERLGMAASFDAAGNAVGRLAGRSETAKTIVTGSHADTVRSGGIYDGQLGIAAGLAAIEALLQSDGRPEKPIELVAFAEEEGSRFPYAFWGVRNYMGLLSDTEIPDLRDEDGVAFREAMREAGFSPDARRPEPRTDIGAYIELHIEQGAQLERTETDIGAVTGIAAQRRYLVTLEGEANHAGTTPMAYRRDALAAFAELAGRLRSAAEELGDPQVLTIGWLNVSPNVANVIPGRLQFTVDSRNASDAALDRMERELEAIAEEAARRHGVSARIKRTLRVPAAGMGDEIILAIEASCAARGVRCRRMLSGAGHDAQIMAPHVSSGMIFVPSRGGVSHSPDEYTAPEDVRRGAETLRDVLRSLAY